MSRIETIGAFFIPLILGLIINIFSYIGFGFEILPGTLGDTRFNIFLLEHAHQYFLGEVQHFWNAGFMYPEAEVISLSDNLLGSAPFYSLFRILGFNIFTSFQCWVILLAFLNYWAAYKLSNYLLHNKWFAGLSAFVFAFSISLSSQMSHAQTFPRFAIPLMILCLLMWRKHLSWKYLAFAVTLLVYQFYCGIYLGFLSVIPFLIVFFTIIFSNFKSLLNTLKRVKTALLYVVSIVINLLLLYKLFTPYMLRSKNVDLHTFSEISHSLPSLKSYLTSSHGALIHKPLEDFIGLDHPAAWDHFIFPGWLVAIFFTFSIIILFTKLFRKNKILTNENYIILFTGFLTFLIFLRIDSYSIYYIVHQLPGFSAMRSLTRIINVQILFFGISLGIVLLYFIKKRGVSSFYVFILILALLVVDNFRSFDSIYRLSKSEAETRHNELVEKMDHISPGTVISYEPEEIKDPPHHYQLDAMLAAQSLHLKSVNGYSAVAPYAFDKYWVKPSEATRKIWLQQFPKSDTNTVVVIK